MVSEKFKENVETAVELIESCWDENGNLMIGECELDLPHYKPVGLVRCSSYYERRE